MSFFCPKCANLLLSDVGTSGQTVFKCQTCPYVYSIEYRITKEVSLPPRKQVDDVLGSAEDWKNVDQTTGNLF
jgi:DNA-directed RNA polymerase subunit M/transcription elongation factor TFIIS